MAETAPPVREVTAPRLLLDGALVGPGTVVVEDGRLVAVRTGTDALPTGAPATGAGGADTLVLPDGILAPGFVDLQVNGFAGVDMAEADDEGWATVGSALPRTGVTSYLPTFITAPLPDLREALRRTSVHAAASSVALGNGRTRVLGAHVEGPFLSPRYRGAHDARWMRDPDDAALDELLAAADALAVLTLAPERDHGLDAVRRLTEAGVVVSVGHTAATAAVVRAAADHGARMVTHLFNAQRALGHREPGVPGQAMADRRYTVGLIADLHHVAGPVVQVVFAACPGRVALVTDAIAAAGMPPGRYALGGQDVFVDATDMLPRRADGTLAGSSLTLDAAVRNVASLGVDPAAALDAVTRVPADVLGRADLGRLAPGALADLVWLGDDLRVRRTWIGGRVAWDDRGEA